MVPNRQHPSIIRETLFNDHPLSCSPMTLHPSPGLGGSHSPVNPVAPASLIARKVNPSRVMRYMGGLALDGASLDLNLRSRKIADTERFRTIKLLLFLLLNLVFYLVRFYYYFKDSFGVLKVQFFRPFIFNSFVKQQKAIGHRSRVNINCL